MQAINFLFDIEGAQEFNAGKLKDASKVGVTARDNSTLEVKLTKPAGYFTSIPAHPCTFPIRKDIVEKHGDAWTDPQNMVVIGPYTLHVWEHVYKLVLKRNPQYWGTSPKIEEIVAYIVNEDSTALHLYDTNKLDHLSRLPSTDLPHLEKRPDFVRAPYLRGYYYGINTSKKPFDDVRIRKAFAMSVDRTIFPKILKGGQLPARSWLPPGMPGHNSDIGLPYDPQQAQKLLTEAGYPDGKGFPKVVVAYDTRDDNKLVAESLQQQWKQNLKVSVEVQNQEWKVHLKALEIDPPHLWRLGWGADYPDPDNFMNLFTGYSGNNHTRWTHKAYDDLIIQAAGEREWSRRAELYNKAQKILCEQEIPIIPLFVETQNILLKSYVKGFELNALDIPLFKTARIEK